MERWKRLEGIWSEFEVSDEGRVKRNGKLKSYSGSKYGHIGLCKTVKGKTHSYQLHRAIWTAFMGDPDEYQVDHRNRNPSDNRLENLRLVTPHQQSLNVSKMKRATGSRYLGVTSKTNGFFGQVEKAGKHYRTKLFGCDTAAAIARDKLAIELYGPHYVSLNFPQLFFRDDPSAIEVSIQPAPKIRQKPTLKDHQALGKKLVAKMERIANG